MNLYRFLFLVLVSLAVISCKKKEPKPLTIAGVWYYERVTTQATRESTGVVTTTTSDDTNAKDFPFSFTGDGSAGDVLDRQRKLGVYTCVGDTLTLYIGPYNRSANNVYKITLLTSDTLVYTSTADDYFNTTIVVVRMHR